MAIHASSTPALVRPLLCLAPGLPPEPLLAPADAAWAVHLRRELERAAEHGTALLAALGLPRLVEPGFVPLDPAAIGDALDLAVATLDALDAPGEDIEPASDDDACFLEIGGEGDEMEDAENEGNDEPSLGAPERHPEPPSSGYCGRWGAYVDRSSDASQTHWASGSRNDREVNIIDQPHDDDELDDDGLSRGEGDTADWEATAPERHGCGFVRCGPDDAEDGYDAEGEYEQGSDDDPFPWGFQRLDAAWRAVQLAEVRHG